MKKKLKYSFKTGDAITIRIPGIKAFKSKIVALDTKWEKDGSPWLVEMPVSLFDKIEEATNNIANDDDETQICDLETVTEWLDDGRLYSSDEKYSLSKEYYLFVKEDKIFAPLQDAIIQMKTEIFEKETVILPKKKTPKVKTLPLKK